MRKRRRLADKLTIMVCAVLVAVSAFFYAPMEVSASETDNEIVYGDIQSVTIPIDAFFEYSQGTYYKTVNTDPYYISGTVRFSEIVNNLFNIEEGKFYKFSHRNVIWGSPYVDSNWGYGEFQSNLVFNSTTYYELPADKCIFLYEGQDLTYSIYWHQRIGFVPTKASDGYYYCGIGTVKSGYTGSVVLECQEVIVTGENENLYNEGYNAGYSAGQSVGYGNGYSNGFADGEASVDTNEIYNQGFNAGKDSVDTQSYYDAGYQVGYQVAYQEGYDSGYDEGYQSAMDRIDGWGADTKDYPLLVNELNTGSVSRWSAVLSAVPSDCLINYWVNFDNNYNPNHTYKFSLQFSDFYMQRNSYQDYVYSSDVTLSCNVGGILYPLRGDSSSFDVFYVPGNRISDTLEIVWTLHNACIDPTDEGGEVGFKFSDLNIKIYDFGPSGDTQNHIANQTDSLTNGFNDSHGNSVNNDFSSGLNDFETAEDSLFATATTGMKDFTFFDISSVPAMLTGMSFVGSIMSGWFTQAGGASGVGIVLSILFSIMLVAMVLGLYRWYQSKGGKD